MQTFETPVQRIEECGADIVTVRLEQPEGYEFRAGQWFRLTLLTAQGPDTRTLSHASSPHDGWIELTTRRSDSAFKQALFTLAEGDIVEVTAAGGRFTLPEGDTFAALIGGIGITPIHSMLRTAVAEGRAFGDGLLVYGNRDTTCEPYLAEFEAMGRNGVRVVRVLEHPPEEWTGERGFISADIVSRHLGTDDGRPFVVSGPPVMVNAMAAVLDVMGIDQARRHMEPFGSMRSGGNASAT
ncbi:MAG TPA: FAD-dependent oxidoreductase [Coriobacteriia bacterium]|nr:FAD-dependent oxidoreductase [Coriobacteriia bacterium]